MNLSHWFHDQLQASGEGFIWSALQVPGPRRLITPPDGLGEWTAARHVFHMLFYERNLALPGMRLWLGGPYPSLADLDEDGAWEREKAGFDSLIDGFRQVRTEQIVLLPRFDDAAWDTPYQTDWGSVTLTWVVSKTYQHTAEHTNDILKIALFWDAFEARQK